LFRTQAILGFATMSPVILGMGNPLLDISAEVTQETFDKYGLEAGNAILAEEKHMPIYAELTAKPDVKYIAGGATQNSIRVAQWMLQEAGQTAYFGCIGDDAFGKSLVDACKQDGVQAQYMVDKATATGKCAVTILDKERSLTTDLGAANNFKVSHVQEPEQLKVLEAAKIVYSAGFFITVSPESMELASKTVAKNGGTYCLNLSAPFIVQVPPFKAVVDKTMPYCDILFGNETEARAYAEAAGWESTDVEFIATRLSLVPMEGDKAARKVVITQGADDTVVAERGFVTKYPVIKMEKEQLVDTNGAGDAFVGGFLAALSKGKDTAACCKAGAYAASVVIQHSGCTYPAKPEYTF
jgi:adenosine kinase